jgi:hypothetical protein
MILRLTKKQYEEVVKDLKAGGKFTIEGIVTIVTKPVRKGAMTSPFAKKDMTVFKIRPMAIFSRLLKPKINE